MFKFKKSDSSAPKMKNTVALKRGVYAIILSVIFIVGVVLLTVLATALAQNFPLELDLTTGKSHSISGTNVEYIKGLDKEVNIYVLLTEDEYLCETDSSYNMCYYGATMYFVEYNMDSSNYYKQTVELLKKYARYNDNIKVKFLDITQPSATEITQNYSGFNWKTGDILVESKFEVDGEDVVRRTHIPYTEVYSIKAGNEYTAQFHQYYVSGMYDCYALYGVGAGYIITENNIEHAVSSAIYKVTSKNTPTLLIPSSYCDAAVLDDGLYETLAINNYSLVKKEGVLASLLAADEAKDYTGILLPGATADISAADRDALEKFLDNGGKKSKSLIFFAGTSTYKLTNLCGFLGDWGIGVDKGILYETNSSYAAPQDPTSTTLISMETDFTKKADAINGSYYVAGDLVPMRQIYENSNTATYSRTTHALMRTASSGTVTIMPVTEDASKWTPASDAALDAFPTAILSEDVVAIDGEYLTSNIVVYSGTNFISKEWVDYSYVSNLNIVLDTVNHCSGATDNPFNFVAKTIVNDNYLALVTETNATVIKVIFMAVLPVILVATGLVVWIRRKRT